MSEEASAGKWRRERGRVRSHGTEWWVRTENGVTSQWAAKGF